MTDKEGDELVRQLAELQKKKESEPPPDLTKDVVINLAELTPLQYAQQLAREAKKYRTPVRLLEKAVDAARVEIEVEKLLEPHWEVSPTEDPVAAAQMFAAIQARILHHIAMPPHLAFVCALWVGYSWIHEHATYSPILFITSAERDSGKTTLSAILGFMVRRSLLSVGISPAALYRSIEKWHPSFVIDEADKAFAKNPDLAEVINSGWTRGQTIVRCDPDTHEPRTYSTFCPKIVALKGKDAPDPTLSRAIFISMKRRTRAEPIADFAHVDDDGFRWLRSQLARWADDNGASLGVATPAMPDGFMNRISANWKLMFAIADSFGAGDRAREAARRILGVTDMPSAGVTLLEDIKAHFDASTLDYVTSKALLEELKADPEKPWAENRASTRRSGS
jgi:putative DNA primase/helicase